MTWLDTTLNQADQTVQMIPLLRDFPQYAPAIFHLVGAIGWCMGVWTVLHAIFMLKRAGQEQHSAYVSPWQVLILLAIATCLVNLNSVLAAGSGTLFGGSAATLASQNPFAYATGTLSDYRIQAFWQSLMWFFRIVGLIAVVSGLNIWKATAEGRRDESVAKGWWHFIGGVLAFHMDAVAGLMTGLL